MKPLYWTMAILSLIILSAVLLIKTSRPVEVVNQPPQFYMCEGTTLITSDNAISNSPQCQGTSR